MTGTVLLLPLLHGQRIMIRFLSALSDVRQVMKISLHQALSSAYVPIGAIMVSPEISDVIHSQSNKLGKLVPSL